MTDEEGADLHRLLARPELPPGIARERLSVAPGEIRSCPASEWRGTLVLVEHGTLGVECRGGAHRAFPTGSLLALGWLRAHRLHNAGPDEVRLLTVRRRDLRELKTTEGRPGPMTDPIRFHSVIELGGKTATGFQVPDDVVAALGSGKRPAVVVRIGSYEYRSTVAPMGGASYLPLAAEHREAAGLAAGDEIDVSVELDTAPRTVDVPPDLAAALDAEPEARAFFNGLSNSNKKWHVLSVLGAKTDETRRRRVEKSVAMLREGRAR